jgi:hypothetical protein
MTATAAKPAPLTQREVADAKGYLRENAPVFARRIAPVYRLLAWHWGDGERAYIPNAPQIEKTLHELVNDMKPWPSDPHIARIETGGLFVEAERERYGSLRVALGFTESSYTFWESSESATSDPAVATPVAEGKADPSREKELDQPLPPQQDDTP